MAWLEEWLLLTPDDPGSNPVIGYFDGMAVTKDQTWGSSNEVSLKWPIGYFPHTHKTYLISVQLVYSLTTRFDSTA